MIFRICRRNLIQHLAVSAPVISACSVRIGIGRHFSLCVRHRLAWVVRDSLGYIWIRTRSICATPGHLKAMTDHSHNTHIRRKIMVRSISSAGALVILASLILQGCPTRPAPGG